MLDAYTWLLCMIEHVGTDLAVVVNDFSCVRRVSVSEQ